MKVDVCATLKHVTVVFLDTETMGDIVKQVRNCRAQGKVKDVCKNICHLEDAFFDAMAKG